MIENVLEVKNLKTYFSVNQGFLERKMSNVKAVDGVTFEIRSGETLGLVGESGCGKTTLGKTIMRLVVPTEGQIVFEGEDITGLTGRELHRIRKKMQMVFQDPYLSLNPRLTVSKIVSEPLKVHGVISNDEFEQIVASLLTTVGLLPEHAERYPHEFSGGQRQRIGIARALALKPKLIVCDEPVSALDVSVQSQILNLLCDVQSEFDIAYLFIAHDLAVVKYVSDRIAVMYLGKIVELGSKNEIFSHPLHPYTEALMSANPIPDPTIRRERIVLEGDVPSPINPPSGCRFRTRCPRLLKRCNEEEPRLLEVYPSHFVACHLG